MDLIDKVLLIYDIPIISDIQNIIYNIFIQEIKRSDLFDLHYDGTYEYEMLRGVTNIINLENDIRDTIIYDLHIYSTCIMDVWNMNYIMQIMQRKLEISYYVVKYFENHHIYLRVTI